MLPDGTDASALLLQPSRLNSNQFIANRKPENASDGSWTESVLAKRYTRCQVRGGASIRCRCQRLV
jgi:hypothetical protein